MFLVKTKQSITIQEKSFYFYDDKLLFIRIKNLSLSKDTINKMIRQAKPQEKVFTKYISDKGLYISGEVNYINFQKN